MRRSSKLAVITIGLVAIALLAGRALSLGDEGDRAANDRRRTTAEPAAKPERLHLKGIENLFRLGPRLYSGGQPEGADGFEVLKNLGIKTIITVDGARPDVETARRMGMRYVHIPVGYDGVPRDKAARIIKAYRSLEGPVFVHCHHGKHRGPTAAALCGVAIENWSKEDALAWMKTAGTSLDYPGLFATVRDFVAPGSDELHRAASDFPEHQEVPRLVDAMVEIDRHWDQLKAIRDAGYRIPSTHPDLVPARTALQLLEDFRELSRLEETKGRPDDFRGKVEQAEHEAGLLHEALQQETLSPRVADAAIEGLGKLCTSCHAKHRDR